MHIAAASKISMHPKNSLASPRKKCVVLLQEKILNVQFQVYSKKK